MNGEVLRNILQRDGYSISRLSELTGKTYTNLYNTLHRRRTVSKKTFDMLFRVTGKDYSDCGDTKGNGHDDNTINGLHKQVSELKKTVDDLKAKCIYYQDKYKNAAFIMNHMTQIVRMNNVIEKEESEMDITDINCEEV